MGEPHKSITACRIPTPRVKNTPPMRVNLSLPTALCFQTAVNLLSHKSPDLTGWVKDKNLVGNPFLMLY